MLRVHAIYNALKHGLLPWWMYEDQKHYDGSYIHHLQVNMLYAWRWITFSEYESDIEFEKDNHKTHNPQ